MMGVGVVTPTAKVGAAVGGGVVGFVQVGMTYTALAMNNGFNLPGWALRYGIPAANYATAFIGAVLGIAGAMGKGPLKNHPLGASGAIGYGAAVGLAQYFARY